jgi:tripeptidyl-peptidase-1
MIALINDKRLEAGKGPVGFINPVIYANSQAFNDITVGNNAACNTDGFNATIGWDPVTGLGTPNFPKLLEVFMGLP